jgi:transcriptional regulator with XRE-family HTH domain
MKPKNHNKLSDQLRQIITATGLSLHEIQRQTGIDPSALSRFLSGDRGVSTTVLDKLGTLLHLRIVPEQSRAKKG